MKIVFKVKRTEGVGVRPGCDWIKYIGKSRIDDFPMFTLEYHDGPRPLILIMDALIVNTKPGYTVKNSEIELIKFLDQKSDLPTTIAQDLVPVKPLSAPSGLLFYMDYVYDDLDPRLLLML